MSDLGFKKATENELAIISIKQKVLITGAKGQVGHCLVQQLKARTNIEIFAYDRDILDITNEQSVIKVVGDLNPDVIINAAAHTAVDKAESEVDLSYSINRDGPLFLAQAAEKYNATMLHISTDYVFDGTKSEPYVENDKTNPQTIYGQSKLAGEQAVINNCSNFAILRTAWVFGEEGNNFVKTMLCLGSERPELGIIADQFGGPTYAGDIAKALIAMMDTFLSEKTKETADFIKRISGVYHFSGEPHVSWFDFANSIFASAKENGVLTSLPNVNKITSEQYPATAVRPANSRLNCDKITKVFAIKPSNWKMAIQNIKAYS